MSRGAPGLRVAFGLGGSPRAARPRHPSADVGSTAVDVPSGTVVWEVACPEAVVGGQRFDVRHRAIVLGVLAGSTELDRMLADAESLVGLGADVLELVPSASHEASEADGLAPLIEALVTKVGAPLAIDTGSAGILAVGLAGGADVVPDLGDDHLSVVQSAGASLMVRSPSPPLPSSDDAGPPGAISTARAMAAMAERGGAAAAAGISRSNVFFDAGAAGLELLRSGLASLGSPVVLSTPAGFDATPAQAMGIALGARILRTRDVRSSRRTADVMAAVLSARRDGTT